MSELNIVISGYGKMGKEIEKMALKKGHSIAAKLDNTDDWNSFIASKPNADVVIDFSMPTVALDVFSRCFKLGIPLVSGTTGWYGQKEEVFKLCRQKKSTFFFAPNFSIGVNVFFYVNKKLASIMNHIGGYDVSMTETHHVHKLDAPSGTAIQAAKDIATQVDSLTGWVSDSHQKNKIPINSIRRGEVTGAHEVLWKSEVDEILLKHEAKNRRGFALGAVLAAEFIQGKSGIFTMNDMLNLSD